MSCRRILSGLGIVLTLLTLTSQTLLAAELRQPNRIILPSCDVIITANEFQATEEGTTYSGDVRVLIGFANLRANKITLIKKPDGHCELVAED